MAMLRESSNIKFLYIQHIHNPLRKVPSLAISKGLGGCLGLNVLLLMFLLLMVMLFL